MEIDDTEVRSATGSALLPLALAGGLVLLGCGPSGDRSDALQTSTTDSAGVTIVETSGSPDSLPLWEVGAEPEVVIGAADGPPEAAFQWIRTPVRLSDGRIAVGAGSALEIRIFSADGSLDRVVGRPGEGPGEFRSVGPLVVLEDDSLLVHDVTARRWTVFTSAGEVGRVTPFERPEGVTFVDPIGRLGRDRIVASGNAGPGRNAPPGLQRERHVVAAMDREGALLEHVVEIPGVESWRVNYEDGSARIWPLPYGLEGRAAVRGDRIVVARDKRLAFDLLDRGGALVRRVRFALAPRPVGEAERQAYIDWRVGPVEDPEAQRRLREEFETMTFPDSMPAWEDLLVDAEAYVWLLRYRFPPEEGAGTWIVFDPEGKPVARVRTPEGFQVTEIGSDWILGQTTDELDVPLVSMYSLERVTSAGGT